MNLFLSRLFGKMWSTEKFDNVLEKSKKDLIRYQQVISTPEFKEMLELKKIIERLRSMSPLYEDFLKEQS